MESVEKDRSPPDSSFTDFASSHCPLLSFCVATAGCEAPCEAIRADGDSSPGSAPHRDENTPRVGAGRTRGIR
eukprot:2430827-Rhodomonas_salina.1